MSSGGDVECRAGQVARAFFEAATKLSEVCTPPLDIYTQTGTPFLHVALQQLRKKIMSESFDVREY